MVTGYLPKHGCMMHGTIPTYPPKKVRQRKADNNETDLEGSHIATKARIKKRSNFQDKMYTSKLRKHQPGVRK